MCLYHSFACLGIKHSYCIMASTQIHRPSQLCLTLYLKLSAWYIRDATDMLASYQNRRYNIINKYSVWLPTFGYGLYDPKYVCLVCCRCVDCSYDNSLSWWFPINIRVNHLICVQGLMRRIPYHTLVLYLVLKRISKHRIDLDSFIYFVCPQSKPFWSAFVFRVSTFAPW